MNTLPVMFRAEKDGDVTAVFPTMPSDYAGRYFTVYAHIGQHGSGGEEWLRSTRPATDAEAADLLSELRRIYETRPAANPDIYGQPVRLHVVRRRTQAHRDAFRAEVRLSLAALREDPAGAPWSPAARAAVAREVGHG